MTCQCIECVGDMPEPIEVENDDGKFSVYFKGIELTDRYIDTNNAWNEFKYNLKRGFYTK